MTAATYRYEVVKEVDQIPLEYLPSVLQMIRAFRESVMLKSAEASFRQGWKEALQDETYPASELWHDIDAE